MKTMTSDVVTARRHGRRARGRTAGGAIVALLGLLVPCARPAEEKAPGNARQHRIAFRPDESEASLSARGRAYAAEALAGELALTGFHRETGHRGPTVRLRFLDASRGAVRLSWDGEGPSTPVAREGTAVYGRGALGERYEPLPEGVRHAFALPAAPSGEGDLLLRAEIDSDLPLGAAEPQRLGGLGVPLGGQDWSLQLAEARAGDAAGRTTGVTLSLEGNLLVMEVDGGWLATAVYPVLIEHFVSIVSTTPFQGRPAVAFDFGAFTSTAKTEFKTRPRYLVAYEEGPAPRTIRARVIDAFGSPVGETTVSAPSTLDQRRPTVAFKWGTYDLVKKNFLVAWERSDGSIGYQVTDFRGGRLMSSDGSIAGGGWRKDPSAAASRHGGWLATAMGCGTFPCRPYLLAYRYLGGATATGHSLALASIDEGAGLLRGTVTIESLGTAPDSSLYAPALAYGHSSPAVAADFFAVAYRRLSGEIVVRTAKTDTKGLPVVGGPTVIAQGAQGPPVIAYNLARDRWGVFWRASRSNRLTGLKYATIRGQMLASSLGTLVADGPAFDAVTIPLEFGATVSGTIQEYSVATGETSPDSSPSLGVFAISYVRGAGSAAEVHVARVGTNGKVISTFGPLSKAGLEDRYVVSAGTRIDPVPRPGTDDLYAPPADGAHVCSGSAGRRCALWAWEAFYSAADHDVHGYFTYSLY